MRTQASRCGTPLLWLLFLTLKSDPQLPSHFFKAKLSTGLLQSVQPQSLNRPWLLQSFLTHFIISIAVLENVPLSRVTEKSNFSTLNVGLAGTGNQTRATRMAGSVSRRSVIHYASPRRLCLAGGLSFSLQPPPDTVHTV
jgi:hypothetical protein